MSLSSSHSFSAQRLWAVCHGFRHNHFPTNDKGEQSIGSDSSTSYTVRDVVNCLSFLVDDNISTSTPMMPCKINCNCPVEAFIVSVFNFHGLPPITKSDGLNISDILFRRTTDGDISINWLNICILALCRGHINTASALIGSYYTKRLHVQYAHHQPPTTTTTKQFNNLSLSLPLLLRQIHRVIDIECPEIHLALENLGTPLISILTLWLRRSYVGILSLQDAILFNVIVLECTEDAYAVYLTVSMICYLQSTIFQRAASTDSSCSSVSVDLTSRLADGFRLVDHLEYVDRLRCRHHPMVDDDDDLLKSE